MAERTLRGARLGGQSFEDERGIEFAARQQVGYRCPQGHDFEITMSVEADIPAVWECPRCGARGPERRRHQQGGEGREAGPHPLGHAARAPLREGARGHPQGASGAAARRRDRPAHLHRANAKKRIKLGLRRADPRSGSRDQIERVSRRRPHRPGPQVRGLVLSGARCPARRTPAASSRRDSTVVSMPRAIGRVIGRMSRMPSRSRDEARAEHQRAAEEDQRPVGELAGRHPARVERRRAGRARPRRPRAGSASHR